MASTTLKWVSALALCCVASGSWAACGYSLAGRGSFLPVYIRTIGIPAFANRTNVFNLETLLTERVRSEFIGRGRYQILPDNTGVDAVLTGEIANVTVTSASFNAQLLASRYVVTVTANIQLRDLRQNMVVWENPALTFRQEFDAATGANIGNAAAFFGQESNALERVSAEFARTIVSAILEAF